MSSEQTTPGTMGRAHALVAAMRPHQWTKNLLVLAALLFARKFLSTPHVVRGLVAFALFCAASSACYLFNDVCDAERDRSHPLKRHRPVASGALPAKVALLASAVLAIAAVVCGFALRVRFGQVVVIYLALQLAYSLVLKHEVIIDVLCISGSFVLRAYGGAAAIKVPISTWLMLCTGLLALFLALAKRRHELLQVNEATAHRRSLAQYSAQMLDQMIGVVTASTLVVYALYTMWPQTIAKFGSDKLKYTIPFVLYGIFRYLYLVYSKNEGGNPSRQLLTDVPLLIDVFLYGVACACIIAYGAH